MRSLPKMFIAILLVGLAFSQVFAADEESLARQAEQAGKLREALTHYVSALQSASEGSSKDQQLREKIISLALKVTPPPAVPDEARRYAVRGKTAITDAKSASDFEEAAREFGKALRAAPWWAESYFNLAVAQEKAGKFNEAIRNLKLYLLAAPNAPDAEKIKDQIYALEYKQEKVRTEASTKRQAEEQARRDAEDAKRRAEEKESAQERGMQAFKSLSGRWSTRCPEYWAPRVDVDVRNNRIDFNEYRDDGKWARSMNLVFMGYDEHTGEIDIGGSGLTFKIISSSEVQSLWDHQVLCVWHRIQ